MPSLALLSCSIPHFNVYLNQVFQVQLLDVDLSEHPVDVSAFAADFYRRFITVLGISITT
jgi:hypothetical protein